MRKYRFHSLWSVVLLAALLLLPATAKATNMTSRIGGAACDDLSFWSITSGVNGQLRYTSSGRGSSDGSNMTGTFTEYWISSSSGQVLDDAEIRHTEVTGLPAGHYKLTMRIRCYDERMQNRPSGAYLYANGVEVNATSGDNITNISYKGQLGTYGVVTVEFEVGSDGVLNFGINVRDYNATWVAWKDVTLEGDGFVPGTYYLYNPSTDKWLTGMDIARAAVGEHAIPVKIEESVYGGYRMNGFYKYYDSYFYVSSYTEIYMHQSESTWDIQPVGDGSFYIKDLNSNRYLASGNPYLRTLTSKSTATKWKLFTKAQMLERMMEKADEGTSVDATFLISNPRMDKYYTLDEWTGSPSYGGWSDNPCAEKWNTTFEVGQTLSNIPNGHYRLTAQGFYRYNDDTYYDGGNGYNNNYRAMETHENGTEELLAELYANQNSSPLQSIASEIDNLSALGLSASNYGMPFSMNEASAAFSNGLYADNSVEVEVTNHQLSIGVRKYSRPGTDWTIWDNFELTLLELGDNSDYVIEEDPVDEPIKWDEATPDNPIDVTQLIENPNFAKGKTGWNGSPQTGNSVAEVWYGTCNVYQIISGLPKGIYRLKANGFYRYGDIELEEHNSYGGSSYSENEPNNVWAVYTIPYAVITRKNGHEQLYAKLFANSVEAPLPSIFDYAREEEDRSGLYYTELGYVPNYKSSAAEAFEAGEYPVELLVPVTENSLTIGVRKSFGYKNDWACWSNFRLEYLGDSQLVYAESISADVKTLNMTVNEQRQLHVSVLPENATNKNYWIYSSDPNVVSGTDKGLLTANGTGTATIYVVAEGSTAGATHQISVTVTNGTSGEHLVVNELQVSNVDMFVDPTYNYGSYIELYNPGNQGVSLNGMYIGLSADKPYQYHVSNVNAIAPAKGFGLIWLNQVFDNSGRALEKLDMDGGTIYLSDSNGSLLLTQTYPAAITRTSYARTTDGGNTWGLTAYPTPGASNRGSREFVSATAYERLGEPQTSQGSQVFQGSVSLNVTIPQGTTLRYTTDGTVPTHVQGNTSSDGQFSFDKTTVLRLRLYEDGKLPSPVKTLSFIQRDKDYVLPVLSVVGDPVSFYSDTLGVFVPGVNGTTGSGVNLPCNWNRDWDRAVAFDYISADGDSCYSQEGSLNRFGGWSRAWYPYNFKLKASALYEGKKYMTHAFFAGKPYLRHKVLQVRNGGNDLQCRIKDASLHQIILTSGFYLDCMEYQPTHVFINGEYIGMENLREPSNKHFGYANYGLDTDSMDQMKLAGGVSEVGAGNTNAIWEWYDLASQLASNPTDEDLYRQIGEIADIDEFINYMAAELFLGGDDWPNNNCKAFKGNDGKFHIVFFDVDQALRFDVSSLTRLYSSYRNSFLPRIFFNMLQNEKFRRQFVDSYSLVAGSVFEPERCQQIIDRMSAEMNPALALEGLSTDPTAGYIKDVLTATRRDNMMDALYNWNQTHLYYDGSEPVRLKLAGSNDGVQLQVNGLPVPTNKFDGTLFTPVTLSAKAPQGYTFAGWKNESTGRIVSTRADYTISSGNSNLTELTATFNPVTEEQLQEQLAMPVKVNELSAGNSVYVNEYFKRNDWIELYNNSDYDLNAAGLFLSDDIDDPMKYQIPDGDAVLNTIIPAKGHLIVWADKLQGTSQLHADFKLSNTAGQHVIVTSSDRFVANNPDYFNAHPTMRSFIDGMEYDAHRGDNSVGRYPDGGSSFYLMGRPTIAQQNMLLTDDEKVGEDHAWTMPDADNQFYLSMKKGWNWISHPLATPISAGSLSKKAQRITGHDREAIYDSRYGMIGTLTSLEAGALYKVQLSADDSYRASVMEKADPYVSLLPGWNWMGYPVNGAQPLAEALDDSPVEDGDQLIGQDGFALYSDGHWTGSLSTLETGKGYLFKTNRAKTLKVKTPEVAINMSRAKAARALRNNYGIDKYAYPNVMGIVAELQQDGQPVGPERFTLLAYSGDECRGVAKWTDSLAFITVYGQGEEDITYRALDNESQTVYGVEQNATFASCIEGSVEAPVVLTLTAELGDASQIVTAESHAAKSVVVGYYHMNGTLAGRRVSVLPAGIYVAKYSDGTFRKVNIQ